MTEDYWSLPSNLRGHSEEKCSSSRHACQNLAVFVIVDAIFVVGADSCVFGHLVFTRSNLPGHSEEKCSSTRHADENVVIAAIIDAMIAGANNIRLFRKLNLLSFSDENSVFCSKTGIGADREAVL